MVCFILHIPPTVTVDLAAQVHHFDNGSVKLDWRLPNELLENGELVVEINAGSRWIPVRPDNTPHIPMHLEKDREHRIEFRLQLIDWEGSALIIIPAKEEPTSSSPPPITSSISGETPVSGAGGFQLSEVGLIYGAIFGILVVACASVVVTILVLKYVQMTRRDADKGEL